MWIGSPVVPGTSVGVTELGGETTTDECLEALVYGCERNAGKIAADVEKYLIRRGVRLDIGEELEYRSALFGIPLTVGFESPAKRLVVAVFPSGHVPSSYRLS